MANIQRGEASFTDGAGKAWHLVMDLAAFADAEDVSGLDLPGLLQAVAVKVDPSGNVTRQPKLKHLGALLYGALQARHPGTSQRDAINLLTEGAGEAIAKALQGAMPKQDESAEGKALAPNGTGTKPLKVGRKRA